MQKVICSSLIVCWLLTFLASEVRGQFELHETFITMNPTQPIIGSGISLADFDHDGWDDITIANYTVGVDAYRNLGDGTFELLYTFPITSEVNGVLWVDIDNDHDADLFCSVSFGLNKLYRNDGSGVFTDISIEIRPFGVNSDSQGCTWGDYDRDGLVDLYVSNRDYQVQENWLFHNDGNGTFTEVTEDIGINYGIEETLQSTWCDINMDGWQDLFVSEDHSAVTKLLINNAGYFTEVGTQTGAGLSMDAMSNTIGDFDRDGDFDIYVTNNAEGNALLQNDNGIFTNVADLFGVAVYDDCWSAIWMDYDLDGDDDLYVGEDEYFIEDRQNYFYINPGSGPFEAINGSGLAGDTFNVFAAGKFDFDNDLKWDFATTNIDPMGIKVWRNTSQTGNSIKFGFKGIISNADGIGTIVHAYHGGELNLIQTYCGENFLTQESYYEIIGLGNDTLVDSLIVTWPSGWVDYYFDLPANAFYMLTEGETFRNEITAIGPSHICPEGGVVVLGSVSDGVYLWSTGDTTAQTTVEMAGTYELIVTNNFGFTDTTQFTLQIYDTIPLEIEINEPLCASESSGSLHVTNASGFFLTQLNDETSGSDFLNLAAGVYEIQTTDTNGCSGVFSVEITEPLPLAVAITYDTISCYGGSTSLLAQISGGTGDMNLTWNTDTPENAVAGEYNCLVMDANNCVATASVLITQPDPVIATIQSDTACYGGTTAVELDISGGTPGYEINWFGELPESIEAGNYQLEITDMNECTTLLDFEVMEFPELAYSSSVTDPFDGQNGQIEILVFGGSPPYNFEWDSNSNDNPLSNVGQGVYTCTITDAAGCSINTEIFTLIDAGVSEIHAEQFPVYPNPFNDVLYFSGGNTSIVIRDVTGRIVFSTAGNVVHTVSTAAWATGVYLATLGAKVVVLTKGEQ